MRSLSPDLDTIYGFWPRVFFKKLLENSRLLFQYDLPRFAGWLGILFFAGLLLRLPQTTARRVRGFVLMSLFLLFVVQALGRTYSTILNPEINADNLLVLLLPLAIIFGTASFLTLLAQLELPTLQIRLGVTTIVVLIACQPLVSTLLPPRTPPTASEPYSPPDIQKIAGWMQEDELIMSDMPWAVAWYGHHQCVWITINSQYTFFQLNDWIKPVHGLFLTTISCDAKIISECLRGGSANWKIFALNTLVRYQLPKDFPLRNAPEETLQSGLFLSDRRRW